MQALQIHQTGQINAARGPRVWDPFVRVNFGNLSLEEMSFFLSPFFVTQERAVFGFSARKHDFPDKWHLDDIPKLLFK